MKVTGKKNNKKTCKIEVTVGRVVDKEKRKGSNQTRNRRKTKVTEKRKGEKEKKKNNSHGRKVINSSG